MMKMKLFMPAIIVLLIIPAQAQSYNNVSGARAIGMGHTAIACTDLWSVFNNQAAAAFQEVFKAGVFVENRYLLNEVSRVALGLYIPLYKGGLCISVDHFGGAGYAELKSGLAYAMRFGDHFSAGLQLDYLRHSIGEGYGNYQAFSFEAGILAKPIPKLHIGVHVFNPVASRWGNTDESIPIIVKAGLLLKLDASFILSTELLKSSAGKAIIMAGAEYRFREKFFLRAGITSGPARYTFGAGFKMKRLMIDIASSVHAYLGYSPQLSFTYSLEK
jgi:hypothetical protein